MYTLKKDMADKIESKTGIGPRIKGALAEIREASKAELLQYYLVGNHALRLANEDNAPRIFLKYVWRQFDKALEIGKYNELKEDLYDYFADVYADEVQEILESKISIQDLEDFVEEILIKHLKEKDEMARLLARRAEREKGHDQ